MTTFETTNLKIQKICEMMAKLDDCEAIHKLSEIIQPAPKDREFQKFRAQNVSTYKRMHKTFSEDKNLVAMLDAGHSTGDDILYQSKKDVLLTAQELKPYFKDGLVRIHPENVQTVKCMMGTEWHIFVVMHDGVGISQTGHIPMNLLVAGRMWAFKNKKNRDAIYTYITGKLTPEQQEYEDLKLD